MNIRDIVHFTDAANVRGTCWDMTGLVLITRLPTKKDPRYVIKRVYGTCRRYATVNQLRTCK